MLRRRTDVDSRLDRLEPDRRLEFLSEGHMGDGHDGVERRQHRRYPLRVSLYIAVGEGIVNKTVHLQSRDISAGGLSFETARELEVDAQSQIIFSGLGDLSGSYVIRGRIVWRKPLPDTGRFLVGVQFTDFEGISREELAARMEEWARSQSRAPAG
jgi:c-di-GMP-binding flagellar brake protein YcgR